MGKTLHILDEEHRSGGASLVQEVPPPQIDLPLFLQIHRQSSLHPTFSSWPSIHQTSQFQFSLWQPDVMQ